MREYMNVIERQIYKPKDTHPLEAAVGRLKDSLAAPYIRVLQPNGLPVSLEIFIDLNQMKLSPQDKEEAIREVMAITRDFYGSLDPYVLNTKRIKSEDGKPIFKQVLWKRNPKATGWVVADKKNDIITKGRAGIDLFNYSIDVSGLLEDADTDQKYQMEAQHIAKEIGMWLSKANESTPLKDIAQVFKRLDDTIYAVNAGVAGEQYKDLYIGFMQSQRNEGYMAISNTPIREYFIVLSTTSDPAEMVDAIYGVKWPVLIHEIVHYLDRKRSNTTPSKTYDGAEEYYNSPMEYNAYFQQGLYKILNAVERNPNVLEGLRVEEFIEKFRGDFDLNWLHYMNEETKKRFKKRMYGLYRTLTRE